MHGSGRSVEEAKERALEQLGVAEGDAEFEIVSEPKTGLFGRVRGEALVKARVRPIELRPKRQRRSRERPRGPEGAGRGSGGGRRPSGGVQGGDFDEPRQSGPQGGEQAGGGSSGASRRRRRRGGAGSGRGPDRVGAAGEGSASAAAGRDDGAAAGLPAAAVQREELEVADGVTLQEQAEVAKDFIEGLLDRYGLDATVQVRELDEDTVEIAATGEGLGVLVGPRGATLAALQDVTRTVVQRRFPNRTDRILIDVAGYRERRIAALRRFTEQVAEEVKSTAEEQAMEPMSAADRKVVHDTVAEIDGVASSSRGEEPNRFVVISPAS